VEDDNMTLSARHALTSASRPASQPVLAPRKLDVNDPGSAVAVLFVQEVQEIYKDVEPDFEPPMNTIFEVAKKHELVATIDHCDEDYWTPKKQDKLLENGDLEGPFEIELYKLTPRGTQMVCAFKMAWPDLRQVALVMPKKRSKR